MVSSIDCRGMVEERRLENWSLCDQCGDAGHGQCRVDQSRHRCSVLWGWYELVANPVLRIEVGVADAGEL